MNVLRESTIVMRTLIVQIQRLHLYVIAILVTQEMARIVKVSYDNEFFILNLLKCGCDDGTQARRKVCNQLASLKRADINECEDGTGNCHGNATCTNTMGSFGCTCNSGFSGNGESCQGT